MGIHVYRMWKVTREGNAEPVNFSDQRLALKYWGNAPGPAEMVMFTRTMPCGIPRRGFCGHCDNGVPFA